MTPEEAAKAAVVAIDTQSTRSLADRSTMTNELSRPAFPSEPKLGLAPVAVVERSPTGLALLPQVAVKIATVVVGLAAIGVVVFTSLMPAAGATIAPLPWVVTGLAICSSIVGLGTVLGIMSPGARAAPGTQPVTLAQPSAAPSSPRVGPPV